MTVKTNIKIESWRFQHYKANKKNKQRKILAEILNSKVKSLNK